MSGERSALNVERSAPRGAVFLSYASQDAAGVGQVFDLILLAVPTGDGSVSVDKVVTAAKFGQVQDLTYPG